MAKKCLDCNLPFEAVVVGGWREGVLDKLVKDYKYRAVQAVGDVLAELMSMRIVELGLQDEENVRLVPLPTIGKHVRQRGIDHTLDLAKRLARRQNWKVERVLGRAADTVQVGTKMADREAQAKRAYELVDEINTRECYVLLDDIWTTGASMLAAAAVLRKAGVQKLLGMVVATGKAREHD